MPSTPFDGLEEQIEAWIEHSPGLLGDDDPITIIHRHAVNDFRKVPDLLGVDKSGRVVIIEVKRGTTDRDVVAQALSYVASIERMSRDQLDGLARDYKRGDPDYGIAHAYEERFGDGSSESMSFNADQRVIIFAQTFTSEVTDTIRYLRTKLKFEIAGIKFTLYGGDDRRLLETETVVGDEPIAEKASLWSSGIAREGDEEIVARLEGDFMKSLPRELRRWAEGLGLTYPVKVKKEWDRIKRRGYPDVLGFEFHPRALECFILDPERELEDQLKAHFGESSQSAPGRQGSNDKKLWWQEKWHGWNVLIASPEDWGLLMSILDERLR